MPPRKSLLHLDRRGNRNGSGDQNGRQEVKIADVHDDIQKSPPNQSAHDDPAPRKGLKGASLQDWRDQRTGSSPFLGKLCNLASAGLEVQFRGLLLPGKHCVHLRKETATAELSQGGGQETLLFRLAGIYRCGAVWAERRALVMMIPNFKLGRTGTSFRAGGRRRAPAHGTAKVISGGGRGGSTFLRMARRSSGARETRMTDYS
jgi:hypothetical protein